MLNYHDTNPKIAASDKIATLLAGADTVNASVFLLVPTPDSHPIFHVNVEMSMFVLPFLWQDPVLKGCGGGIKLVRIDNYYQDRREVVLHSFTPDPASKVPLLGDPKIYCHGFTNVLGFHEPCKLCRAR